MSSALVRAFSTVGSLTLLSRIAGFARDMSMAFFLGAGVVADAFIVAFRLPNFFRSLFAEGAFNAAFLPAFSRRLRQDGMAAAMTLAQDALAALLPVLLLFCVVAQLAMPWLLRLLAPGFEPGGARYNLAVEYTIITFPYLLFISLVSLQGGILNGLNRFAAVAFAPVLLNLVLIAALWGFAGDGRDAGRVAAWGVYAAGVAQFLWLMFSLRREGVRLTLGWPRLNDNVKSLLRVIGPAAVGAGAAQINLLVGTALASLLAPGAVSALFYADRLNQLPIGVIGIALGTALLPIVSRHAAAGENAQAMAAQNRALEIALFFALPSAVAFLLLAEPIMITLFERGAFGREDSVAAAQALQAFALGLPGMLLARSFLPGFHGRQDTRTPMTMSLISISANIALSLVLMGPLGATGLALAGSIALWVNAGLLAWVLWRRDFWRPDGRLWRRGAGLALAAAAMGVGLWLALPYALPFIHSGAREAWAALGALVLLGLGLYGVAALLAGGVKLHDLKGLMKRQSRL